MSSVRIPASLNDEDVFLAWGPIKLSMRELVTIVAGFFFWFGVARYMLVPIANLTIIPALLLTIWIVIAFFVLAFTKIENRPIDQWIGDKINFIFGTNTFILKDTGSNSSSTETDLYNDDDIEMMLDAVSHTKAFGQNTERYF